MSNQKYLFLPCTANTLQGWVPWRDDSLFPPLMKAGRLGLLWSPTNFPGCCPIRAGCQAAAGSLQALSHARRGSGEDRSLFPWLSLSSPGIWVMGITYADPYYSSMSHALMEPKCFRGQRNAFHRNLEKKQIKLDDYLIESDIDLNKEHNSLFKKFISSFQKIWLPNNTLPMKYVKWIKYLP